MSRSFTDHTPTYGEKACCSGHLLDLDFITPTSGLCTARRSRLVAEIASRGVEGAGSIIAYRRWKIGLSVLGADRVKT